MKTLKIAFLLCIMLAFTSKALDAQTIQQRTIDVPVSVNVPCIPESATGTATIQYFEHFDKSGNLIKWQFHMLNGKVTGEVTGIVYTVSQMVNQQVLFGKNGTYVENSQIIVHFQGTGKDGVMLRLHDNFHITTNPNGDTPSFYWDPKEVCE
jgi:hypothetical protein